MVEAKPVELRNFCRLLPRIDFVDDEKQGLSRTPKKTGKFLVGSCDAGSSIDDEKNNCGAADGNLGLLEDSQRDFGLFAGDDTAGIDNFVGTAMPTDNSVNAVTRYPGFIGDDGSALADKTIKESRLSNI